MVCWSIRTERYLFPIGSRPAGGSLGQAHCPAREPEGMRLVLWQEIPGWAFLFLTMAAFYPAFMFLLFSVIVDTDQEYFAAAAHFLNIVLSLICFIALAAEAPAFSSRMRAVPPDFQLMLHGAVSVQFCLHGDSGYHFDNIFLYLVYCAPHSQQSRPWGRSRSSNSGRCLWQGLC